MTTYTMSITIRRIVAGTGIEKICPAPSKLYRLSREVTGKTPDITTL